MVAIIILITVWALWRRKRKSKKTATKSDGWSMREQLVNLTEQQKSFLKT